MTRSEGTNMLALRALSLGLVMAVVHWIVMRLLDSDRPWWVSAAFGFFMGASELAWELWKRRRAGGSSAV